MTDRKRIQTNLPAPERRYGTPMIANRSTDDLFNDPTVPVSIPKSPDAGNIPEAEVHSVRASAGMAGATHQISPNGVASSRLWPDVPVEGVRQTKTTVQGKDRESPNRIPDVHGVRTSANGEDAPMIGPDTLTNPRPRIGLQKAQKDTTMTTGGRIKHQSTPSSVDSDDFDKDVTTTQGSDGTVTHQISPSSSSSPSSPSSDSSSDESESSSSDPGSTLHKLFDTLLPRR